MNKHPDLVREQQATLLRPRLPYCGAAKFFFFAMDCVTGRETTLPKAKLIEMVASIPYRAWEIREYGRLTAGYADAGRVKPAQETVDWSRAAQDNEYGHLLVIHEKMRQDGLADPWYLAWPIPALMVGSYRVFCWLLARIAPRTAYAFNAQFEDHAEHVYAQFVADHPEWETQPVDSVLVTAIYGPRGSWAEVFRRIGLDEREHRNASSLLAGLPEWVVAEQEVLA